MEQFVGSPWTGALVAIALVLVVVAVLRRYRALERAGTPLPPGVGGARMVGTTGVVVTEHAPDDGRRGQVHVLGEDWVIADTVTETLPVGATVRVEAVTGTRLHVTTLRDDPGTAQATDSGADPSRRA